jgi:hypothetical protein
MMLRALSTTLFLGLGQTAHAYTFMMDADGHALRWSDRNPWQKGRYLPFAGNVLNQAGVYPEELQSSVVRGLQRWQRASSHAFEFDYWQGEDRAVFRPCIARDGLSAIYFLSADPSDLYLGPGTAAYTQLWYDDNREVVEADIVLNDLDFVFVVDPLQADYVGGPSLHVAVLEDVVTHELGHALGISHSGVMRSTMFPWSWSEQTSLSCDDIAGVRSLYAAAPPGPSGPRSDDTGAESPPPDAPGSISGRVVGPEGLPLWAAQVSAISRSRRVVEAAALTDRDGRYRINGLEPGEHYLLVEPFYAQSNALPEPYAEMSHRLCGEDLFARTFLVAEDGRHLQPVNVTPDWLTVTSTIGVTCGEGVRVPVSQETSTQDTAPLLPHQAGLPSAMLHRIDPGPDFVWFDLGELEGPLAVHAQSWSLFSPVVVTLDLFLEGGVEVTSGVQSLMPLHVSTDSDARIWDAQLTAHDLPVAHYWLRTRSNRLAEEQYPRGDLYIDATPFVLLYVEAPGAWGRLAGWEPADAECAEPGAEGGVGAEYASPAGPPRRRKIPEAPIVLPLGCDDTFTWGNASAALLLFGLAGLRRRP